MKENIRFSLIAAIGVAFTIVLVLRFGLITSKLFVNLFASFASLYFLAGLLLASSKARIRQSNRGGLISDAILVGLSTGPLIPVVWLNTFESISLTVVLVGTLTGAAVGVWLGVLVEKVYLGLSGNQEQK